MKNKIKLLVIAITVIISSKLNSAFGQVSVPTNAIGSTDYVGSSNTNDVLFKGNGTLYMTLKQASGRLGIGVTSPAELLQVAGNVRIGASNGFMIGTNRVLWHDNNIEDIFVGVDAGNNSMTGRANSFIGNNAGNANTSGDSLTFVGYGAGEANTEGRWNTAIGCQALNSNPDLLYNTAVGYQSMYLSSTCPLCWDDLSAINTAVGYQSLYSTQGYGACAFGFRAGYSNDEGCGIIAIGEEAMHDNTDGNYNLAIGAHALQKNTLMGWNMAIGHWALNAQDYSAGGTYNSHNVAVGHWALEFNKPTSTTTGFSNTAVGNYALNSNITGSYNTAIGYHAGFNSTKDSNVFVGYGADVSIAGGGLYQNCAAFGYGSLALASDKFYFGNTKIIGCYNATGVWASWSDGRFKINVEENVSGLDFINRLRPVTYNIDAQAIDAFINPNNPQPGDFSEANARPHSGFIAQEVEQAALQSGFSSSIVSPPSNANDLYALNYAEFVVPLVKAVQELDSINQLLQSQIDALQAGNRIINSPEPGQSSNERGTQSNSGSIELQNLQSLQLLNADPNPFSESTMIRWNIPNDFKDAMIYFYDNSGTQINSYKIEQKGIGELQVFGSKLSSGSYVYSLVVDSKLVDSKKLVKSSK